MLLRCSSIQDTGKNPHRYNFPCPRHHFLTHASKTLFSISRRTSSKKFFKPFLILYDFFLPLQITVNFVDFFMISYPPIKQVKRAVEAIRENSIAVNATPFNTSPGSFASSLYPSLIKFMTTSLIKGRSAENRPFWFR
jgi:hypothetical protein